MDKFSTLASQIVITIFQGRSILFVVGTTDNSILLEDHSEF